VRQVRLASTVSDQIRAMILDGHMPAGERLPTESDMMERFNVGRSTIREAMKQLQAEHVVEIRHGTGTFVADRMGITRDPLGLEFAEQTKLASDLMEARLMIEPSVSGLAAERRSAEDLEAIREAEAEMERAVAAGESYDRLDTAFHIAIAASTHNSVLERMYLTIFEAMEANYQRTRGVRGSVDAAILYHTAILRALEAGDRSLAAEMTEKHIRQTIADTEVGADATRPVPTKGEHT